MTGKHANDGTRAEVTALRPFRRRLDRRAWPLRSIVFRPARTAAAIAAALVALTAAFGGAPASASTAHASSTVSWHALSLLNGWRSDQGQRNSGNPSWAVKGGVVYLSGSLHQPSGSRYEFTVLPPAARPADRTVVTVYTANGTSGYLDIGPDGQVSVYTMAPNTAQDARGYTSLAGVSFLAASTAVHPLSLLNSWQGVFAAPAYRLAGGIVHLDGSLHQSAPGSAEFAVLPAGARPARVLYLTVYTDGGPAVLMISPDGEMQAYQGKAWSFTSLTGVSFRTATTGAHKLNLRNGWQSGQPGYGTGDPVYTVAGGVVHLSGSLLQSAETSLEFAVLPRTARPRHNLWITTYTFGGAVGALLIKPSGVMEAFNHTGNAAQSYTSLAGIAYPLGS
jgi:hypothetical protein